MYVLHISLNWAIQYNYMKLSALKIFKKIPFAGCEKWYMERYIAYKINVF